MGHVLPIECWYSKALSAFYSIHRNARETSEGKGTNSEGEARHETDSRYTVSKQLVQGHPHKLQLA